MGLTNTSTGLHALNTELTVRRKTPSDKVAAIAGNPNVGKSTLFNSLTGARQHTGNWPGKTVASAQGWCKSPSHTYVLVDIPGTYSLMAHSAEEEAARNFLCFGGADAVAVVCDATCLERNLNLVLQILEIKKNVLVCVNLLDEAQRKGISIDTEKLSRLLGVPVLGMVAQDRRSRGCFLRELDRLMENPPFSPLQPSYCPAVEEAVSMVLPLADARIKQSDSPCCFSPRWLALRLLEGDPSFLRELTARLPPAEPDVSSADSERRAAAPADTISPAAAPAAGETLLLGDPRLTEEVMKARNMLRDLGIDRETFTSRLVEGLVRTAETIAGETVTFGRSDYSQKDRRLDKIFTSRLTGYPVMAGLLALIFWLTLTGANYPSALLSHLLFGIQELLGRAFQAAGAPWWLQGLIVDGMYRTLAWVVSVMLPPMAIFFPLFTLLEDSGFLPRIAYNLDKPFMRCQACGKQALTMAMGFGCNAAGVAGCRIIDSPRERLIAMLTNSFVPCNGRFPTLTTLITMFFAGTAGGLLSSLGSALFLTLFVLLGIGASFVSSWLLSRTVLKGIPSSFTLELPPYRRPQAGRVLLRSILDRTVFVLGRAASVAAPAGLIIWLMANARLDGASLLAHCCAFLNPLGQALGMDGVILTAFLLGLPANEIVIPLILMAYLSQGTMAEAQNLVQLRQLLTANGWTWVTALCTMIFSLMHWPCSTTLLTIKKESGSWKWTALAFLLPTVWGMALCFLLASGAKMFL